MEDLYGSSARNRVREETNARASGSVSGLRGDFGETKENPGGSTVVRDRMERTTSTREPARDRMRVTQQEGLST